MTNDFPTPEQEAAILRRAALIERTTPWPDVMDLCCHVKALLAAVAELRAERDRLRAFLSRFLNPEELGLAVPAHVRDDVRVALGRRRVET